MCGANEIRKWQKEASFTANFISVLTKIPKHPRSQRVKTAAEAASRAKTAFIQNMDEQIRQPLYSAVSCARTIANSIHSYAPKVQLGEYNSTLQKSTDDILRLVADVLDKAQGSK